ncbi:MAG: RNA polymerase sigma factor [Kiritimatiellia bacterium]|jgi:RNA polymerase sigma-70 factor (ECF subfamily)
MNLRDDRPNHEAEDDSAAEDIALMLRAKADDLAAFSQLVRKHQNAVMNFFRRSGVYRDVEDLAQEAFLKLYRARRGYRPAAKFTTFLYLIARRVMIDSIRRSARQAKLMEGYGKEAPPAEDAPAMRGERSDAEKALDCLSPAMRETVALVVMQGLTYAEAASVLGIPEGTAKSRVSAAMRQMRAALETPGGPKETGSDVDGRREN